MTKIKTTFIKEIEDWINNYPRAMFDYKSSNMILLNFVKVLSKVCIFISNIAVWGEIMKNIVYESVKL